MNNAQIKEVNHHLVTEIIPKAHAQASGEFSVKLIGCDSQFAELELRIVEPNSDKVVHTFGRKTINVGGHVRLSGLTSNINFLPEGL